SRELGRACQRRRVRSGLQRLLLLVPDTNVDRERAHAQHAEHAQHDQWECLALVATETTAQMWEMGDGGPRRPRYQGMGTRGVRLPSPVIVPKVPTTAPQPSELPTS